jgi:CRP/FNR family transcriptional regulator
MGKMTRPQIVSVLRSVAMFSALDEQALEGLLADCRLERLSAGRVIFLAGQKAERFFVMLSGRVKVYQLSAAGDEQTLHLYGPGQTFAEAVALSGGAYPASAAAVSEATVLAVPRGALRRAVEGSADLAMGMLAGMSGKLQEFTRLIERLSLRSAPARLAGWLLEASSGGTVPTIRLRWTKRQLASQLGTAPETLSRALGKLRSAGLIEVDGRCITIRNARKLAQLAEGS